MNALNQADVILSPSEFLRSIFVEQGIDPDKISYSRLGLDTSHWITPSKAEQKVSNVLQVSYIGQLAPHKGVHLLLNAFNQLVYSDHQSAHLTVYGDPMAFPDYTKSLRAIANGNPAIEFAGRFDNRRVADILSKTDVIVAPSVWYENSPIAIMEALTTGTPVVTSNLGGMSELVQHNENGLLFETGDSDDLTRQLQRLVDEPELAAALAKNARPVRMIDDEMAQILSLYESVAH
jgi:glycosyltransferase involved in cell wall biosynthesis